MDSKFFEQMAMPLFDQLYNLAHWLTGDPHRRGRPRTVRRTPKALKGFRSFQEGTNLRAWMYRILRNTFLTSRTGLAARNTLSLDDDAEENEGLTAHSVTPELLLLRQENQDTVMDALASIPVNAREIILLCEIEELSYREIAQVLSVPVGTVMSRLSRARKLLSQTISVKLPARYEDAL